uniref:Uncharacterized protein n=1 Tax=Cacopsylla melanoneura TaxID=428564 RepID=A0A8D8LLA2_9HEMI
MRAQRTMRPRIKCVYEHFSSKIADYKYVHAQGHPIAPAHQVCVCVSRRDIRLRCGNTGRNCSRHGRGTLAAVDDGLFGVAKLDPERNQELAGQGFCVAL